MIVLGIETSCDETAVAIVNDKKQLLSNVVLSQVDIHKVHGGVVPEIAARAHHEHLDRLVDQALAEAKLTLGDIDGFAATCGPGLIGGVMVGMITAKALAWSVNKPFIAINHLEGHALTPRLTDNVPFPYFLLLVSGGHTQSLIVNGVGSYEKLGTTLDDAVGECFDKSAKMMGLPYPGGPELEILASECKDCDQAMLDFPLPSPMKGKPNYDFSFSGLKTAVLNHIESIDDDAFTRQRLSGLAYALQYTIADILKERCEKALSEFNGQHFVISGGVAANKTIRSTLEDMCIKKSIEFVAPPLKLCTDNGAMIAWAGMERLSKGHYDDLDYKARPRWPLEELEKVV